MTPWESPGYKGSWKNCTKDKSLLFYHLLLNHLLLPLPRHTCVPKLKLSLCILNFLIWQSISYGCRNVCLLCQHALWFLYWMPRLDPNPPTLLFGSTPLSWIHWVILLHRYFFRIKVLRIRHFRQWQQCRQLRLCLQQLFILNLVFFLNQEWTQCHPMA